MLWHPERVEPSVLYRLLLQPHDSVTAKPDRQEARLVAAFQLVIIPVSLVVLWLQALTRPDFWPVVFSLLPLFVVGVVAYALARTRWFRVGTWMVISLVSLMTAMSILQDPGRHTTYSYLLVPGILASAVLSFRSAVAVTGANVVGAMALAAVDPTLPLQDAVTVVGMLVVTSAAVLFTARHRGMAEQARRAELEIRDRRQSALLEAGFGGMALVRDGEILDCSRGFAAIFGYRSEEIQGRRLEQILAPTEREATGEREAMHRDGHIFPVEVVALPYEEAGETRSAVAVRDLTETRRIRAQLHQADRMATMGQLAAGVAHEINNPLSWVLGNLDLLVEGLRGEQRDVARRAAEGARRVERIVRDLKTFSRTRPPEPSAVVLPTAVSSAVNMIRHQVRDRGVLIEDYAPVPTVDGDETRVGQVCLNLLVNALEALPDDQREANRIEVRLYTDDSGEAVLEVADNGPGIPTEVRHRMFEPFFTTKRQGTGLGLSITRSITASLGGRLVVDSQPGLGTTMRVILPAGLLPPGVEERPAAGAPQTANRQVECTVLVVDDELDILELMAAALPQYQVTTASSADEALSLLEGGVFDAILCDLMMPDKTGMELHDEAIARWPGLAGRFAFVTGGAYTEAARTFLDQTQAPVLHKPFQLQDLRALTAELVEATTA